MVTEPTGTKGGVGGGYMIPLMEETANALTLPLNTSKLLVEISLVDKELMEAPLMLPLIVLKLKVPILLAVIVPVLTKIDDMAAALITFVLILLVSKKEVRIVSAVIKPVLRKLVLRKPVLIGSNELLIMPPFEILMPPFTLMVDAFRVEGMPLPPPGTYGVPLIVFTVKLLVLMATELIAAARTIFVLRVFVARVAAWTVFVLMVIVLIEAAVIAFPL
jgi:hypothetical protein